MNRTEKNIYKVEARTSPEIMFEDLAQNWLNNARFGVKEQSLAVYNNKLENHISPYFYGYRVSEISTEMIEMVVNKLLGMDLDEGNKKEALSDKTVDDILIIIKSILKFGKCDSHLDLKRIKVKKEKKKPHVLPEIIRVKLHDLLLKDIEQSIVEGNIDLVKLGILFAINTGIRAGELCGIDLNDDIDYKEGLLHIRRTVQRIQIKNSSSKTKVIATTPKSEKSIRDIPIPKFLIELLCKINGSGYLLTGNKEKYMEPRTLHNYFKKYLKHYKIADFNFHMLRHSFAKAYIDGGCDPKSLSEMMGHSSVKITLDLYVYSDMNHKRRNMEKMAEKLVAPCSEKTDSPLFYALSVETIETIIHLLSGMLQKQPAKP